MEQEAVIEEETVVIPSPPVTESHAVKHVERKVDLLKQDVESLQGDVEGLKESQATTEQTSVQVNSSKETDTPHDIIDFM